MSLDAPPDAAPVAPRAFIRRRPILSTLLAILALALFVGVWYLQSRLLAPWRRVRILPVAVLTQTRPATKVREFLANPVVAYVAERAPGELRVGTWNLAHGRGSAFGAGNWTGRSHAAAAAYLDLIAAQIRDADLDIVVLNEIDFDCNWSRRIDQARYIAERTGHPYLVEQRNFDGAIPFLSFNFGNAILSRHPITAAEPLVYDAIWSRRERLLLGNHDGVLATIATPAGPLRVFVAHLDANAEHLRVAAMQQFLDSLPADDPVPILAMGDFNSAPDFAAGHETSWYGPENAIDLLLASGRFQVGLAPAAGWDDYLTFPAAAPVRGIDWILASPSIDLGVPTVIDSRLSDHRMVSTQVQILAATKVDPGSTQADPDASDAASRPAIGPVVVPFYPLRPVTPAPRAPTLNPGFRDAAPAAPAASDAAP